MKRREFLDGDGVGRELGNFSFPNFGVVERVGDIAKFLNTPQDNNQLTGISHNSAGELTTEELERIVTILQTPTQYKIPTWFLNRQRDITDGKDSQVVSNGLDSKLREDLERLKKIRSHRGLRHYWGLRVRGQHTKTTGRRGRTVGVSKKKG